MPLRDWSGVRYLPILSLRPGEMRALEELPGGTKDTLLPIVHLRPWTTAHHLDSAIERIATAYGDRPIVVGIGDPEAGNRPVHVELNELRDPSAGFKNWRELIEENENFIPAIQFSESAAHEDSQISRLYQLNRGLVAILEGRQLQVLAQIAERIGQRTQQGEGVCFVLDFGQVDEDHLQAVAAAQGYIRTIRRHAPAAVIAPSASSFPDSFTNITRQSIFERQMFDHLTDEGLIYSDRGSARVERQTGGGGLPAPRIDYALPDEWRFYRSAETEGFPGYQEQAQILMNAPIWEPKLRVWGTQMIERTAAGDENAIGSPQKATATRINLHLQRQSFYSSPVAAQDTEEDWSG